MWDQRDERSVLCLLTTGRVTQLAALSRLVLAQLAERPSEKKREYSSTASTTQNSKFYFSIKLLNTELWALCCTTLLCSIHFFSPHMNSGLKNASSSRQKRSYALHGKKRKNVKFIQGSSGGHQKLSQIFGQKSSLSNKSGFRFPRRLKFSPLILFDPINLPKRFWPSFDLQGRKKLTFNVFFKWISKKCGHSGYTNHT